MTEKVLIEEKKINDFLKQIREMPWTDNFMCQLQQRKITELNTIKAKGTKLNIDHGMMIIDKKLLVERMEEYYNDISGTYKLNEETKIFLKAKRDMIKWVMDTGEIIIEESAEPENKTDFIEAEYYNPETNEFIKEQIPIVESTQT